MEEKIKKLLADHLGVEQSTIMNDSSLFDDLGADSLDSVEIVMLIEEEFEIELADDEADSIFTVQEIIDIVTEKTAK